MRLSELYVNAMDKLINIGLYGSKSEIIRDALRLFFEKNGISLNYNDGEKKLP